jgi:IPT/TIG domain-containing protein
MQARNYRQPAFASRLALFVIAVSALCFSASGNPGAGGVDPAPAPGFAGLSFRVKDATIPPGGMFQFQLMLTEPKPIAHGSTSPTVPAGSVSGIALNDPIGQTAGVAILNSSGIRINFNSPLATFGTSPNLDYPILTIRMPVAANAPVGWRFPLSIDMANSFWFDAAGQPYPQEIANGELTIGGTLAISDVVPGGFQPAGARITILGMGFTPNSRLSIDGVNLGSGNIQFVSGNEIDVVLPSGLQLDGTRVRVVNPDQTSTFFPYFHAEPIGASTHPLLAQTYPLFARKRYAAASLPWSRAGSQFTGLALQNSSVIDADVELEMRSVTGNVLGTMNLLLPAGTRMTRDLLELFPGATPEATSLSVISSTPIQMLGLLGDDFSGDVVPVMMTVP